MVETLVYFYDSQSYGGGNIPGSYKHTTKIYEIRLNGNQIAVGVATTAVNSNRKPKHAITTKQLHKAIGLEPLILSQPQTLKLECRSQSVDVMTNCP